jgi:iron(III) transport system ATP-binding protein
MTPQLVVTGVTREFGHGGAPAVDDLSLTVARGEIVALVGPSGCGKTTTLRLVAGFERPDAGEIRIAGAVVALAGRTFVPPERRHVGVVFQDFALFPHLTVGANVGFGLAAGRERGARVGQMLDLVGLADVADRYPHQLSGGQQQRVAVARALAPAPTLMLFDEPFSNLDADLREQVRAVVHTALRATGTTALFVTHDQEEALELGDRVGVMARGRIEQIGPPDEVYHEPVNHFVAEFLGAAAFLPGVVAEDGIRTEVGLTPHRGGATGTSVKLGTEVDVLVRPDDVSIVPSPSGTGVLLDRVFRGSEVRYTVQLPSGLTLPCSQPSATTVAVGTRVDVAVEPDHVVAFPRRAGAHSADQRRSRL